MTLKQIFKLENIHCVHLHDILKKLLERFVSMLHLCVFTRFVAFRVTFTVYAVERNVAVYCYAYN